MRVRSEMLPKFARPYRPPDQAVPARVRAKPKPGVERHFAQFTSLYGDFHVGVDYEDLAIRGLDKPSGCIRGSIVHFCPASCRRRVASCSPANRAHCVRSTRTCSGSRRSGHGHDRPHGRRRLRLGLRAGPARDGRLRPDPVAGDARAPDRPVQAPPRSRPGCSPPAGTSSCSRSCRVSTITATRSTAFASSRTGSKRSRKRLLTRGRRPLHLGAAHRVRPRQARRLRSRHRSARASSRFWSTNAAVEETARLVVELHPGRRVVDVERRELAAAPRVRRTRRTRS